MKLNLSSNLKGFIYLVGGAIGLLYIHGLFVKSLYYPLFAGSLAAFIYGFVVSDTWDFCKKTFNKFTRSNARKH
jgi:hypothetical protein